MQSIANIALFAVSILDAMIQWGLGWRYVFSASFRRSVHQRWRLRPRLLNIGEAIFICSFFLVINVVLALILWRLLIGPIRPVHEWVS